MTNPTCPICQASQEATDAQLKGDKVIILLTCANGHEREVEVLASRFSPKQQETCTVKDKMMESGMIRFEELLDHKFSEFQKSIYRKAFYSAWETQQRKLDAYAAYVAGKITLKELEEITSA